MSQKLKTPKCPNYGNICTDREGSETIYTDKYLKRKITRRLKFLAKLEGRRVYFETGVLLIDDDSGMYPSEYIPEEETVKEEIVFQIMNLINITDSM